MLTLSWKDRLYRFLAKRLLGSWDEALGLYRKSQLSKIVVVGTVGKSSVTLLLSQLFRKAGYTVLTGTSVHKNLNTLPGLLSSLMQNTIANETLWQHIKLLASAVFYVPTPTKNTILIQEIGYDEQGGAQRYIDLFKKIDTLIVTALTDEHNGGFSDNFDNAAMRKVVDILPSSLKRDFFSPEYPTRLKNIALEQLQLLPNAIHSIMPTHLGTIENTLYIQDGDEYSKKQVYAEYKECRLVTEKVTFSGNSLFPLTFARNEIILCEVAKKYNISTGLVTQVLENPELPYGRFSKFAGKNDTVLIDSTYNSDPASLNAFLDTVEYVASSGSEFGTPNSHTLVLGEMRELGEDAQMKHSDVLRRVQQLTHNSTLVSKNVVLLGTEWSSVVDEFRGNLNLVHILTVGEVINYLQHQKFKKNDWIWFKGSQNTIFLEEAVKSMLRDFQDTKKLCRQNRYWMAKKIQYL